jgi:hypothetical protein
MNALLANPIAAGAFGAFILLFGALLVSLPYLLRNLPAFHPASRLGRLEARWAKVRDALDHRLSSPAPNSFLGFVLRLSSWLRLKFRYPELGGYVHDSGITFYIPPTLGVGAVAAWTAGAGQVADTIAVSCDATDETATFTWPVMLLSHSHAAKGSYLRQIDLDYEITAAATENTHMTALVNLVTRGADGADAVVAAQTFTYSETTAASRGDVDEHFVSLTLATPIWIDEDQYVLVEVTFDKAATTLVHMYAMFARCTLRL